MRFAGFLILLGLVLGGLYLSSQLGARATVNGIEPTRQPEGTAPRQQTDLVLPPSRAFERVELEPAVAEASDADGIFPDPLEVGPCALELRFYDAANGQPVSSDVQLWRLGAPANEHWFAGDQKQLEGTATEGRLLVENLPPGAYRAYVIAARSEAPTPAAFEVAGERTVVEWPVSMPTLRQASLSLFRTDGAPIVGSEDERVEFRGDGEFRTSHAQTEPDWLAQRKPKAESTQTFAGSGGGYSRRVHQPWVQREAGPLGFDMGTVRGDSRAMQRTYRQRVRVAGRSSVVVEMQVREAAEFVAVFVEHAELQARLRFPAGVVERDLSSDFSVFAEALAVGESTGRSALYDWSSAKVRIRLQNAEFEPVSFTWCPADGPLPEIVLVPAEVGESSSEH